VLRPQARPHMEKNSVLFFQKFGRVACVRTADVPKHSYALETCLSSLFHLNTTVVACALAPGKADASLPGAGIL
jgi:hypothetical protein